MDHPSRFTLQSLTGFGRCSHDETIETFTRITDYVERSFQAFVALDRHASMLLLETLTRFLSSVLARKRRQSNFMFVTSIDSLFSKP